MAADDPLKFIQDFEEKFEFYKSKPRVQFLQYFKPREFYFYMLIISELRRPYRPKAPFGEMFRTFPLEMWEKGLQELLKKFVKKQEKSPRRTGIENGMGFLEAACQEFPEFFADQLDDVFISGIEFPGHFARSMWQRYGKQYVPFLQLYVDTNKDDFEKQVRALSYALIVGDSKLASWAKNYLRFELEVPRKFIEGLNLQVEMINKYLREMGLEWQGNDVVKLYTDKPLHLTFPYRYLHTNMEKDSFYKHDALPTPYTFGGAMVARNKIGKKTRVQHFLYLDPIPKGIGVTGLARLMIACDLDEVLLTAGSTYQAHAVNGAVTILDDERRNYPEGAEQFEQGIPYVKSTKIIVSDQGPSFHYQRYGQGENYYRLGGTPIFISDPYYPKCCKCNKTMAFILQLDSTLPLANGKPLEWGVEGMAYVYWCDRCKVSAFHWYSE